MRTMFLILIGVVFVVTLVFGILIWRQTIKIEKKALEAKRRQAEYQKQLEMEKEEELLKQRELERQAEPGVVTSADNPATNPGGGNEPSSQTENQ